MLNTMQTVGLDMGFGWMKVWSGPQQFKFPAVVARGNSRNLARVTETFTPGQLVLDVEITDENTGRTEHYFLGDLAVREGEQPTYVWAKNKVQDEMAVACMATSLALVAENDKQDIYLITGLPIAHFGTQLRENYEKHLRGRRLTIKFLSGRLQGKVKQIRILSSKVFPQGYGAYLDQLMDDQGGIANTEYLRPTGVLDIGFKTSDIVFVQDMQPVDRNSFPLELGMAWAYEQVQRHLSSTYDIHKSLEEMEEIFEERQIRINRDFRRIDQWVDSAYQALTDRLKNEIARKWLNITDLETILVAGGGGIALFDFLDFPQKVLPAEAQFANAKGFWKAGQKIAGGLINAAKPAEA